MRMRINGEPVSEFVLHAYAAAYVGVPVVFVSGDKQLCADIEELPIPNIVTVAISEGKGPSTISASSPKAACAKIRAGVEKALKGDLKKSPAEAARRRFTLEIEYSTIR